MPSAHGQRGGGGRRVKWLGVAYTQRKTVSLAAWISISQPRGVQERSGRERGKTGPFNAEKKERGVAAPCLGFCVSCKAGHRPIERWDASGGCSLNC